MKHKTNQELIAHTHNTSRFFVENPQISWAALVALMIWGAYSYLHMPQRKDPEIPVRLGVASCSWPGATAEQVEQLVTRPIEQAIAQNKTVHPPSAAWYGLRSVSTPGQSTVTVQLSEDVSDTRKQFTDIRGRLQALNTQLPQGAGPIQFQSDFGDTAAMMLTIASPQADSIEIQVRAYEVRQAVEAVRRVTPASSASQVSILYAYPLTLSAATMRDVADQFRRTAIEEGWLKDGTVITGNGFAGVNGTTSLDDKQIESHLRSFTANRLPASSVDPDVWPPIVVRDPAQIEEKLTGVAGSKYTFAQLDRFTDLLSRSLLGVPQASRVDRSGVLQRQVTLGFSLEKLASYGLVPANLSKILSGRNVSVSGGTVESGSQMIALQPSGAYEDAQSIGDTIVGNTDTKLPIYLRDLVTINEGYQSPTPSRNYYTWFDHEGKVHRSRAVTISVYMRSGDQIQAFGKAVDRELENAKTWLPSDLIIARTSDQPLQVKDNISLFMRALCEAIILVIVIALVGFWDWRSALLMALAIPITLAMTFGFVHMLNIDLQQVSIASLIIALGLLVDDPVVANDAIKRELSEGMDRPSAAWIGPTKLATAIVYATLTNIIAYLPFLLMTGNTGDFLYSLPIVMTASLIASRLVSMSFIPLIARYLLKAPKKSQLPSDEKHTRGFYGWYQNVIGGAIRHRWAVLVVSGVFLAGGIVLALGMKSQFFPDDTQYWSYIDVWLPDGTPIARTNEAARQVEDVVRQVIGEYEQTDPSSHGNHGDEHLLQSLTSFVGVGGPRFWFSVSPQSQQTNYAQLIIRLSDKNATPKIVGPLQTALAQQLPGVQAIVQQLQTNPVEFPVEVRFSSTSDVDPADEARDNRQLRQIADKATALFKGLPGVSVVQLDWLNEAPTAQVKIDTDRANAAGITNTDIAYATLEATDGVNVGTLRQDNKQIPIVARLQTTQRANLSDVQSVYVSSSQGPQKLPLSSLSTIETEFANRRIRRQEHFRTIGIHVFPLHGVLPSELISKAMPALKELEKGLPPGYRMVIGGEIASQKEGFLNLALVLLISATGIYTALLMQFKNAIKPLLVFAAVPYGIVGALLALVVTGTPFGFMAFLGIISLIGVIVSHIIVLFDFIEEMHEKGEPLEQALRDAGVERLRPVLITVGATVFALFPLAYHGGPLWKPLCYSQIGGLAAATVITLLLVPVLYSIAVLDLKIVKWEEIERGADSANGGE